MPPLIKMGSQGQWVKYCQNSLNARLIRQPALWVDGQFGVRTEFAVRGFQAMKFLKTDGKVGDDTWVALETAPPPIQKRPPEPRLIETHGGGV